MASKEQIKRNSRPGRLYQMPLPGMAPRSDWVPTPVSELPTWANAKVVSLDIETCDPDLNAMGPGFRRGAFVVGYAFRIEDHPRAYYLPIRHGGRGPDQRRGLGNLDENQVLDYLTDQVRDFQGELVGAGLPYDLDGAHSDGVNLLTGRCTLSDVLTGDVLTNELHNSYSLDAVLQRRGLPGKDEDLLRQAADAYGVDPKKGLWRLPAAYVGGYAERDVNGPLQIREQLHREFDKDNLWDAWHLEQQVTRVATKMTVRGVRVNVKRLEEIREKTIQVEREAWELVKSQTGIQLAVGDAKKAEKLEKVLESIGVTVPRTAEDMPNIDKFILAAIDHPVAEAIARAREWAQLRTNFCDTRLKHLVNDRIHPSFNQTVREKEDGELKGARSWRLSATDPAVQQEPSPDRHPAFGKLWRSIYVGEPGELFGGGDYSQQEPRGMLHYADMMDLPGAAEMVRRYLEDPTTDFHNMTAAVTGLPRKQAKDTGLGLAYGMGGAKLCREKLRLPVVPLLRNGMPVIRNGRQVYIAGPEGQAVLDKFHAGVPWLKKLVEACQRKVKRTGSIRLLLGHLCRFPRNPITGEVDWTHKALNRLIQGLGAEQMKKAMVDCDDDGLPISITVHDELCGSFRDEMEIRRLGKVMREGVPLRPGNKVDLVVGPSWGEAVDIAV